jgi:hypothetical protein
LRHCLDAYRVGSTGQERAYYEDLLRALDGAPCRQTGLAAELGMQLADAMSVHLFGTNEADLNAVPQCAGAP